jgi:hypothetical protein
MARLFSGSCVWLLAFSFLAVSCSRKPDPRIGPVFLPDVLTFAGDTIPLWDPEIKERLEKELIINQYWEASTIQWLRKAGRWYPLIDSVLKKNGVPEDLKYLVPIESGFENVSSHKGAVGFWQMMEPTAKEFGLRIDAEVDERLHVEKSTQAACQLLKKGKQAFGRWPEAAVSYNIGISGLRSVLESQYTDSFYDVLINPESGRYLFRILAAKLLLSFPEKYGYAPMESYPNPLSKDSLLGSSIPDLPHWCRQNGFSFKCFRTLNPWIRTPYLHVSDSMGPVQVRLPLDCRVYTRIQVPNSGKGDSSGTAGPVFTHLVEEKDMKAYKSSTAPIPPAQPEFHVVVSGESLSLIAQKYNLSLQALISLNARLLGPKNQIRIGQSLRIKAEETGSGSKLP